MENLTFVLERRTAQPKKATNQNMEESVDFGAFFVRFPDKVEEFFGQAYGQERWQRIKYALALPPSYTAIRVNTMRVTREKVLVELEKALESFNAKLIGRNPVRPFPHACLDDVIVIPSAPKVQTTPVQVDSNLKSIVVDRLCGEAVLRGSDIYARGIMSASSGINVGDRVNVYVDLDHLSTRGSQFDDHRGRKLLIAHGTTQMSRTEMFRAQRGLAIDALVRVCDDAPPMNGLLEGKIYVQNLPSTIVAHVLAPQHGDIIFDMCAAPGGKTSHLATLMKDTGILVCADRSKKKALGLKTLFEQLEFKNVFPLKMDTTQSVLPKTDGPHLSVQQVITQAQREQSKGNQLLLPVKGFYPETFDKILLDPPCSALGLRPRLLHAGDCDDLEEYSNMQRNFLWAASFLLKPGGILVYSTCTINPKENEQMVRYILDTYPFDLIPQGKFHLGDKGLLNQGLNEQEAAKVQRFDPSNRTLDTMGFFCAKLIKTKSILSN